MVERIKRADVANLVRSFKGGNFDQLTRRDGTGFFQKLQKAFVQNNTGSEIEIGQKVFVQGDTAKTFEKSLQEYLETGFYLTTKTSADATTPFGFALEPIKRNGIGEIFLNGITAALVSGTANNSAKINSEGKLVFTSDLGGFAVIYRSTDQIDSNSFCYLAPRLISGHLKGVTMGELTGPNNTVSVRVNSGAAPFPELTGVYCPLLDENEKLPSSTSVIISKNLRNSEWEIIHWREEPGGHLVGVTRGTLTGTGSVTVRVTHANTHTDYEGVTCPLLRGASGNYTAETIEEGTTVVISKNMFTGKWQIIEAQCPRS